MFHITKQGTFVYKNNLFFIKNLIGNNLSYLNSVNSDIRPRLIVIQTRNFPGTLIIIGNYLRPQTAPGSRPSLRSGWRPLARAFNLLVKAGFSGETAVHRSFERICSRNRLLSATTNEGNRASTAKAARPKTPPRSNLQMHRPERIR